MRLPGFRNPGHHAGGNSRPGCGRQDCFLSLIQTMAYRKAGPGPQQNPRVPPAVTPAPASSCHIAGTGRRRHHARLPIPASSASRHGCGYRLVSGLPAFLPPRDKNGLLSARIYLHCTFLHLFLPVSVPYIPTCFPVTTGHCRLQSGRRPFAFRQVTSVACQPVGKSDRTSHRAGFYITQPQREKDIFR